MQDTRVLCCAIFDSNALNLVDGLWSLLMLVPYRSTVDGANSPLSFSSFRNTLHDKLSIERDGLAEENERITARLGELTSALREQREEKTQLAKQVRGTAPIKTAQNYPPALAAS